MWLRQLIQKFQKFDTILLKIPYDFSKKINLFYKNSSNNKIKRKKLENNQKINIFFKRDRSFVAPISFL